MYSIPEQLPKQIFRAYDVRGVVDETLTEDVVYAVGLAVGAEVLAQGQHSICIARDGRLSGPKLLAALKTALLTSGCDVIDLGAITTPALYFATYKLSANSGVMLTGSHNPSNYNGLKIVVNGQTLFEERITGLYERIVNRELREDGQGHYSQHDILPEYFAELTSRTQLSRPLKVVVDCGNGIAGVTAPEALRQFGCDVIELYSEVDGNFPNHHPDPSKPENLQTLIAAVEAHQADVGLGFDGDGDRLGVVTDKGEIIWPDRQLMYYAIDVLSRHPGAEIIYDVKCSQHLAKVITEHGGKPIMWKTGHSLIKAKLLETGAPLAGEMSGHIFFSERWYGFDDALYNALRLLEIASKDSRPLSALFAELPNSVNTPELHVAIDEDKKFSFVDELINQISFPEQAHITTMDGLRVDFANGWGLVRASNTTPCLVVRFEADSEIELKSIQDLFRKQLLKLNAKLELPF